MEAWSMENPAFRAVAAACAVLVLKNLTLALSTGSVRAVRKAFSNPEDVRFFGANEAHTDDLVERIRKAHAHSTENDYAFMILALLYAGVGGSALGAQAYAGTYVLARLAHVVTYVLALQPFRTIAFAVGVLVTLGLAVQVLLACFG